MIARLVETLALCLAAVAILVAPAAAAPFINGEFVIPGGFDGSNNKLVAGPDGNIWMTLDSAEKDVAKITPAGGVEEFDLEATSPRGITAGPDNFLWITRNGGVTKFSPEDPEATKDPTEIIEIVGNHSIATGPDGNLWVATDNNLVSFPAGDPADHDVFPVAGLAPKDIDTAGSVLAIADFNNRIVVATTAGTTIDFPIPGGSQGVAGGPNGQIAYSQQGADPRETGLLTPPGPALVTKFQGGDPFGVTFGTDGAYWYADSNGDQVIRQTTDNQTSTLGGFTPTLGPRQITDGPGNTLWVSLDDFENKEVPEKVARISGVDPPAVPPISGSKGSPQTKIDKGPKKKVTTRGKKAKVTFKFSSPDAGAAFECALTKLKKPKKGKKAKQPKPKFKGCKSPKSYKLKPGRYRFEVRAVLAGVADASPAKKTFTVVRKKPKKRR